MRVCREGLGWKTLCCVAGEEGGEEGGDTYGVTWPGVETAGESSGGVRQPGME